MRCLIALGVALVLFLLGSAVCCIALAWIHYPQGIIRAFREKRKQKKEERHEV